MCSTVRNSVGLFTWHYPRVNQWLYTRMYAGPLLPCLCNFRQPAAAGALRNTGSAGLQVSPGCARAPLLTLC